MFEGIIKKTINSVCNNIFKIYIFVTRVQDKASFFSMYIFIERVSISLSWCSSNFVVQSDFNGRNQYNSSFTQRSFIALKQSPQLRLSPRNAPPAKTLNGEVNDTPTSSVRYQCGVTTRSHLLAETAALARASSWRSIIDFFDCTSRRREGFLIQFMATTGGGETTLGDLE